MKLCKRMTSPESRCTRILYYVSRFTLGFKNISVKTYSFRNFLKKREFPGGPVVRTLHFHCWGPRSIPGRGTKILQVAWCGQRNKKLKKKPLILAASLTGWLLDCPNVFHPPEWSRSFLDKHQSRIYHGVKIISCVCPPLYWEPLRM